MTDSGPPPSFARDLIALGKPRITLMAVIMSWTGLWLGGGADTTTTWAVLLGTALIVASANAVNMIIERDGDKLMARTATRPLPAGRISTTSATLFAVVTGAASVYLLGVMTHPLTLYVGLAAHLGYVAVYTPLKRRSSLALPIGAIPGAAPPLLGWTAATHSLSAPGLVLFAIMFLWQLPHFLAISVYLKKDYAEAGIRVVPLDSSDQNAQRMALTYTTALIPVSAALWYLGVAGPIYLAVALLSGCAFWAVLLRGLRERSAAWAKPAFLASLLYLPVLILGLLVDGAVS